MTTADRFDRYVESLMGELVDRGSPAYIDEALATATARPQRRPSLVSRLLAGPTGSNPAFRFAAVGLPVVLLLTIGIVGLLVIGGPDQTPSPSPVPTLTGTDAPTTVPPTSAPPTSAPTNAVAVVEPCAGYVESADARTLDETGGEAWQGETGPPPRIGSLGEGLIAAEARDLPDGRPAVVLVDPATGDTCRVIDLGANEQIHELAWTLRGDALAISTQFRALVWSSTGLTELYRVEADRTSGFTVAWAPTGESIAVGSGADELLRIVERTSSWTDLPIAVVLELAWSPDGRRLHVGTGTHTGFTVLHELVTGDQVDRIDIGSTINDGESVAGWLDNDKLIVGSSGELEYDQGAPGYDTYDVASGTRQPWASTEPFNRPIGIGYAPGLTAVALFAGIDGQNPMDLVVRDLPFGVDRVLEPRIRTGDRVGTGAWSPNGSRLAVSIQAGRGAAKTGLWLYALDGSEPTQVSTLDLWLTNGAWQPVP